MEFEREEVEEIRLCLEERSRHLTELSKELEKAEWNNIGGMQNMYANEQAFNEHKKAMLETQKNEIENIDNILERIYEEV